jgi:hypothetical protein
MNRPSDIADIYQQNFTKIKSSFSQTITNVLLLELSASTRFWLGFTFRGKPAASISSYRTIAYSDIGAGSASVPSMDGARSMVYAFCSISFDEPGSHCNVTSTNSPVLYGTYGEARARYF